MYLSTSMLALIVIGAFILGIITPIIFITRFLSKRNDSFPSPEDSKKSC